MIEKVSHYKSRLKRPIRNTFDGIFLNYYSQVLSTPISVSSTLRDQSIIKIPISSFRCRPRLCVCSLQLYDTHGFDSIRRSVNSESGKKVPLSIEKQLAGLKFEEVIEKKSSLQTPSRLSIRLSV